MLPTGTVTFLLTDLEGSTRLWEQHPRTMGAAIARHDELIEAAVADHEGVLIRSKGEGDSTFSVFGDPSQAIASAVAIQIALNAEPWPEGIEIRARAALYTSEAEVRDGDYYGIGPNRCARLRAVAHGGQTICARATERLVADKLSLGITLRDLGLHRLRDLARAERVFQVCDRDLPGEFPPLLSLGVRHNLPAPRTSFVGREHDLIAVRKHMEVDRLVTLTGLGGCGKTRLAVEVAGGQLERHPDGVFFVDLTPVSDPHVVPGTVAEAVGFARLALGTGSGRPAAELLDFLSTRNVLLVLDNCEHVIDACADLVDEILERCPSVSVLATSREALELRGEQTYPVPRLAIAEGERPEDSEAVRLFCERARMARPGFVLTPEVASDVAEICRRLDGLPLAIELAAAQAGYLSPSQIAERLTDRLRLSGGGRRSQRQRTLEAALDWSFTLLRPDERVALHRLSVFPSSFSLEAAEAVCDELPVTDMLRSLVGKSLLVTEEGPELRYRLLETVRIYAERKLVEAGEEETVRNRHRDHFLTWTEAIPPELTYLDPDGVIQRERHDLRAALTWSFQQDRPDLVARLASTMNRVWIADIGEGRRWLTIGMQGLEELEADARVRVLTVAAHVAVLANEAQDGELARRAVEASGGRPGVWSSLAHSLLCFNAGLRCFFTKNPVFADEVERLGATAVELAPDPLSRGLAWFWVAQARVLVDDFDGAIASFEQASDESVPEGDMSMASLALMAGVLHLTGHHDRARAAAELVIQRARSTPSGLWAWALYCSLPYALELGVEGRHAEAIAFVRELLEEGGTPRTPGVMTSVVIVLGALAMLRGDEEVAAVLLGYAGAEMLRGGVRTPVDLALHSHYLWKVGGSLDAESSVRCRDRGAEMSLDEALAFGLR